MIDFKEYKEYELEGASNSYLMSVVFLTFALPLPLINLIATFVFYHANKKNSYFIKWHSIQALLSQASLFIINTILFVWAVLLLFKVFTINNYFVSLGINVLLFNTWDFISTIYSAIKTRKGIHVKWFFYGLLTDKICSK